MAVLQYAPVYALNISGQPDPALVFPGNLTEGSTIVLVTSHRDITTFVGVSDTQGMTWTLRTGPTSFSATEAGKVRVYTAKVGSADVGPCTVTIDLTAGGGSHFVNAFAGEWAAMDWDSSTIEAYTTGGTFTATPSGAAPSDSCVGIAVAMHQGGGVIDLVTPNETAANNLSGAAIEFGETALSNGQTLTAQATCDNSFWSNALAVIVLKPEPAIPDAPTITDVGVGGHQRVGLQWTAGYDGSSAVTDWDIDAATAAAPTSWLGVQATGSTNLYGAYTGLTNGTAYVFRVRAVNAIGDGAWSATSGSATPGDVRGHIQTQLGDDLLTQAGDFVLRQAGPGVAAFAAVQPLIFPDAAVIRASRW